MCGPFLFAVPLSLIVRAVFLSRRPIFLFPSVLVGRSLPVRKPVERNQSGGNEMNRTYRTLSTMLGGLAAVALAIASPSAWADDDDDDSDSDSDDD